MKKMQVTALFVGDQFRIVEDGAIWTVESVKDKIGHTFEVCAISHGGMKKTLVPTFFLQRQVKKVWLVNGDPEDKSRLEMMQRRNYESHRIAQERRLRRKERGQ